MLGSHAVCCGSLLWKEEHFLEGGGAKPQRQHPPNPPPAPALASLVGNEHLPGSLKTHPQLGVNGGGEGTVWYEELRPSPQGSREGCRWWGWWWSGGFPQ